MGGTSTQAQQQQSQTAPWAAAQPLMGQILGQLSSYAPNLGVTNGEQNALNTITQNGTNSNQFTPAINNSTASLLAGGGALNQAPMVQNAYNQFNSNTSPLANNTNYNPYQTPGFSDALNTMNSDITNQINGQFAAAGRDMSGANAQTLARGLSQGEGQLLQQQYQNNIANQQAAAGNLYNAGNTSANALTALQQQMLQNQQSGVNQVGTGLNNANAGSMAAFNAGVTGQTQGLQNLGLLANIGIPIAGLGSQSSGSSNVTNQMSGAQQFATILGGLGSLIPKGPLTMSF